MLVFEQLESALHKWAHCFQCNNFEYWELINAVWAKGNVQKLKHIALASARIKYDMIDYMRDVTSQKTKVRGRVPGRFYPDTFSLSSIVNEGDSKNQQLQDILKAKKDHCKFDTKDLFDTLLKGLSRTSKLIIFLRYECDLTLEEIAKTIGVTDSYICLKIPDLLKLIGRRLIKMGIVKREGLRVSSFKNKHDKDALRIYNRWYYFINKDRIQRQRAELRRAKAAS